MKPTFLVRWLSVLTVLSICQSRAEENIQTKIWTDPDVALREDPDFSIQGEYGSAKAGGAAYGIQVVALGGGVFDAYVLEGGLPGSGWTPEKSRILLKGESKEGNTLSLIHI